MHSSPGVTFKVLLQGGSPQSTVPFEYQGNDGPVHHPPVAFLPRRVGLWVVGGQDDPRGARSGFLRTPAATRERTVSGSLSEAAGGVLAIPGDVHIFNDHYQILYTIPLHF